MSKNQSKLLLVIALTWALISASGCQTTAPRVVLVPPIITNPETLEPTDLVKVGPDVEGRIYVQTPQGWELSDNEVALPEGWFLVPPPPIGEPTQ